MATYQALGTGPVSFVDGAQKQYEIPLSAITFGPAGPDASAWPNYSANSGVIDSLLTLMVNQGLIVPGVLVAPVPSLNMTASDKGPFGNMISVTFSSPSAALGTVTVEVSSTDVYPSMTPATLSSTITKLKGLVTLSAQPAAKPLPVAFSGGIVSPATTVVVPDAASDVTGAFTLATVDGTYDLAITVTMDSVVAPAPQTFTLQVVGTKTVTKLTVAKLIDATKNPFITLVSFSAPASGATLPAAGTVTLQGGAAATSTSASAATGTAFSS